MARSTNEQNKTQNCNTRKASQKATQSTTQKTTNSTTEECSTSGLLYYAYGDLRCLS